MEKRIVVITDCTDIAYNEIRGTILSNIKDEDNIIIEPVVSVKPFSIINGNFILRLMADVYPDGTIFSIILNPSQKRPERLIGKIKNKDIFFMGANTGVFTWIIRDFDIEELYELNDPGFIPFGGKYVHAPSVAKIASGTPLINMGKEFNVNNLVKLDVSTGTIVHIDNFGLIKFTGNLEGLHELENVEIYINGVKAVNAIYTKRMMSMDTGRWVIYPGSSFDLPELGKVRENGASEINVKIGDIVTFKTKTRSSKS